MEDKDPVLSVVVLGGQRSGKTSVCNALLGLGDPNGQKTVHCAKHRGQVGDKMLMIVDTPGWWPDYPLIDTAERIKRELILSVQHCPPGPHVVLLTIQINSFMEKNLRSVQEHLGLFGDKIWDHTVIVFTRGKSLENRRIENYIEEEGTALKWVVEKCKNRYCVYEEQDKDPQHLITLLDEIEKVVADNDGKHFESDKKTISDIQEKTKDAHERAKKRMLKVQEQRPKIEMGLSEVRLVILGSVSSGKTMAKNVILNTEEQTLQKITEKCERHSGTVCGKTVTVIDCPGWWKYFPPKFIPEEIKDEIEGSVSLGTQSPNALLLVVPADVSFLEEQKNIIQENMKMFGEMAWKHTIVLFTWGDSLGSTSIEEHIESEGEALQWLVEKCGNRYHVFNNIDRGDGAQVRELLQKVDEIEANVASCSPSRTDQASQLDVRVPSEGKEEVTEGALQRLNLMWNGKQKELEKRISKVWQEEFGNAVKGNESEGRGINFRGIMSDFSSGDQRRDGNYQQAFEREWRRLALILMQRLHPTIFSQLNPTCQNTPQPEPTNEMPSNISERIEREWARYEAIIMENVHAMIALLHSGSSSDADEQDIAEAFNKVTKWLASSGIYSQTEDEEIFDNAQLTI